MRTPEEAAAKSRALSGRRLERLDQAAERRVPPAWGDVLPFGVSRHQTDQVQGSERATVTATAVPATGDVVVAIEQRRVEDERRQRLERLFRAHSAQVLAYALRRVPERADDVVADTFAVAWRRLDSVPVDAEPWLYGVARKVVGGYWRSRDRDQALVSRLCAIESRPAVAADEPDFARLHAALGALREADREALLLVHWEGLAPERASQALGISREAFNQRVHRARERLRTRMEAAQ
jgi:RNA polymerase sigma-70 factor (ECF subfamily)